jgi:hypothetical protein
VTEATDELFLMTNLCPASTGLPMGTAGTRPASETPPEGGVRSLYEYLQLQPE